MVPRPFHCCDPLRQAVPVGTAAVARVTAASAPRLVGRALAALRSYGSPAVPSWAVRGTQDALTRF